MHVCILLSCSFFFKFSEHEKLRKGGSEPRSVEILKLMSTLGKSSSSIGYDPLIASNRLFSFLSTHCSFTRLFSLTFTPSPSLKLDMHTQSKKQFYRSPFTWLLRWTGALTVSARSPIYLHNLLSCLHRYFSMYVRRKI